MERVSRVLLALTCVLATRGGVAHAQQDATSCYTSGSIVGAVFGTLIVLALLAAAGYLFWKYYWRKRQGKQLTLVADPEAGLSDQQYAFDNPGFLTEDSAASLPAKKPSRPTKTAPDAKAVDAAKNANKENKSEVQKGSKHGGKWQAWSPLSALVGGSGKHKDNRRTLDDSFIGEPERNVVSLRGHDFTGLGFNICGNMRDGIFVRDVLHRGPASESGRIAAGDRIVGINISFKHMVFEDALTILSYASPYDVQLEVEKSAPGTAARETGSGKRSPSVGPADRLCHPFYRSQSIDDLAKMRRSSLSARKAKIKKSTADSPGPVGVVGSALSGSGRREEAKLEQTSAADNPRTSRTSVTMPKPERAKKPSGKPAEEAKPNPKPATPPAIDRHTKFGIRVLPPNIGEIKLGGTSETTQNEQNTKIELSNPHTEKEQKEIENVTDNKVMLVENKEVKIEKIPDTIINNKPRIEDVVDNIPTEMPEEMRLAAMAAKTNRKSVNADKHLIVTVAPVKPEIAAKPDLDFSSGGESAADGSDTPRKNTKRKAPPPPTPVKSPSNPSAESDSDDSDMEHQESKSKGGGTTIELNSAHITIHQSPKEEEDKDSSEAKNRGRKTASLGDLSRLESEQPMSIPLERAVSLDMADVTAPVSASGADATTTGTAKKRKAPVTPDDEMDKETEESDEENTSSSHSHHFVKKEPRLMDAGMSDTFRRRLKKSSDWGTLEEALLVSSESEQPSSSHQVVLVSGSEPSSLITIQSSGDPTSLITVQSSEEAASMITIQSSVEPSSLITLQSSAEPSSLITVQSSMEPSSLITLQSSDEPTSLITVQSSVEPSSLITLQSSAEPSSLITVQSSVEPTSLITVQSSAITSSHKSPSSIMSSSDVVSVQVVTSSTPDVVASSPTPPSSPRPSSRQMSSPTRSDSVADSSSTIEFVTTTGEFNSLPSGEEPPELPTSPIPVAQTGVREFSLASPNTSPVSNFHHSMTYITTASTPSSPQHHVTEIQVLTGGNVSTAPIITENVESTTSVRHGTSGGNLLLLPSVTANLMNGPESLEETLSSFTSTHSEMDDERGDSPARNNITVMSINTNGPTNHVEHNNNMQNAAVVKSSPNMEDVTKITETREVIQITPGELDSVMMSHSHYLLSTQAPEPTAGSSSTFEQWVFLDNGTPINGVRQMDGPKEDSESGATKTNTTTMVVNLPPRQSVTHIVLEAESKAETDSKNRLNSSHGNFNT